MKLRLLAAFAVLSLLFNNPQATAAEKTDASVELKELIGQIEGKLKEGKRTEAALAPDLAQFDVLLTKHKDEKTDDVAQIQYMKAMLYLRVLDNNEKGVAAIQQLKRDFPDTKQGKDADKLLASIKEQEEGKKIAKSLTEGSKFPDFAENDVLGKPLSLAKYKGKVVMIDFWATWCGPCVAELPHVLETYKKHHGEGFEIVGITLDQQEEKLTNFTKTKNMPWQQFFDGKGWSNKLAVKYGIHSIPMTYLLDGEGKIIGVGLRGEDLESAVTTALAKK